MIHTGDCVEVMAGMEPESVDAIVCDPPYGLEFMGKEWDRLDGVGQVKTWGEWPGEWGKATTMPSLSANVRCVNCNGWKVGRATNASKCRCDRPEFPDPQRQARHAMQDWHTAWATAALRVAKPGAYLLAFGGTRTCHRLTVALEDAGWIIRDLLVWAYAQGFPKSRSSLKPAWEPIVLARKPGPLRELAIDGCRIGENPGWKYASDRNGTIPHGGVGVERTRHTAEKRGGAEFIESSAGRWPANVILTDPIFDGGWEGVVGGGTADGGISVNRNTGGVSNGYGGWQSGGREDAGYGDTGTYSRFFLIPKASRSDREPLVPGELEPAMSGTIVHNLRCLDCGRQKQSGSPCRCDNPHWETVERTTRRNTHPTVKPVDLMRHLVRLVTPQGGTVLDPFAGSGSTLVAAEREGFDWIGIEREAEYVAIAETRLLDVQSGMGL